MATPGTINQIIASDFHRDLTIVPGKADIARKANEEAVKESIRNLILTNRGERPYQPDVGCNVRGLLFENITPQTLNLLEESIRSVINGYEPRCNLIGVDVTGALNSNTVTVTIVFSLINSIEPITFSIILDRIR
jgi:phage baseplate assembly protein W